jgi:hypothetical protein
MSICNNELEVVWDSDEFRACEIMAQQETRLEVAISRLVDFHGMVKEEALSYYIEAINKHKVSVES